MRTLKAFLLTFAVLPLFSGAGFAQSGSNLGVMDQRLATLEAEIQRLTGKIEEQSYEIRELKTELNRRLNDAELRLSDLEEAQRSAGTSTSTDRIPTNSPSSDEKETGSGDNSNLLEPNSSSSSSSPSSNTLSSSEATALYEEAFSTLRSGDYDSAEDQFSTFLERYPDNNLAGNARYWLGETYYVRNQYTQASKHFAQAYQTNPQGSKAADNLLKLGLSLVGMGQTEDACVAWSQLLGEYDSASRSIVNRAEREAERAGCDI